MSEPSEPRKGIAQNEWENFLKDFSERNKNRRARFNVFFSSGESVEEAEEGHFKNAFLEKNADKMQIVIERVDRSEESEKTMSDPIDNVRVVTVQYETDGSENILEITDEKNTLFSLRFESKLDGNS